MRSGKDSPDCQPHSVAAAAKALSFRSASARCAWSHRAKRIRTEMAFDPFASISIPPPRARERSPATAGRSYQEVGDHKPVPAVSSVISSRKPSRKDADEAARSGGTPRKSSRRPCDERCALNDPPPHTVPTALVRFEGVPLPVVQSFFPARRGASSRPAGTSSRFHAPVGGGQYPARRRIRADRNSPRTAFFSRSRRSPPPPALADFLELVAHQLEAAKHLRREAVGFIRDFVRQPLVMDPGRLHRVGHVHPMVQHVEEHLQDGGDDRRSSRRTGRSSRISILRDDGGVMELSIRLAGRWRWPGRRSVHTGWARPASR